MNKIRYIIACLPLFLSCRHDLEKPGWSVEVLAPVLSTSLNITDILPDSITSVGNDSLIELVFESKLASFGLPDVIPPFGSEIRKSVKLNSIDLGDTRIVESISLGEVAKNAGVIGSVIIANHGRKSNIPPIDNMPTSSYDINANDIFESLTLEQGFLDLKITNEFPIEITDLQFQLKNKLNGEVFVSDNISSILPQSSHQESYDLAGKTIEGLIEASLITFSSPGSNGTPVDIDTSDIVEFNLNLRDLIPYEATAVFPEQVLVDDTTDLEFISEGNVALKEITIRSGYFSVEGISTIYDSVKFDYKIPSATKDGKIFETQVIIPPAPEGGTAHFIRTFDFAGYHVDLTGINGDDVNLFYDVFEAKIDSSGRLAYLTLDDSVYLYTQIVDIVPENGFGYLGNDTFTVGIDSISLNDLEQIPVNALTFNQAAVDLSISNGFGATAAMKINHFRAKNSSISQDMNLTGDVLNEAFELNAATLQSNDPFVTSSINNLSINNDNSNITDIVNLNPNELEYGFDLFLDPNRNNTDNFIYYDFGVDASLQFRLPLDMIARQLILKDTALIKSGEESNFKNIEEGNFKLIVENGFPLSVDLKIYFLDEMSFITDSIIPSTKIPAAVLGTNGIVEQASKQTLELFLDTHTIAKIRESKSVVYQASFDSAGNSPVKIFSQYQFNAKLIADVTYNLGK